MALVDRPLAIAAVRQQPGCGMGELHCVVNMIMARDDLLRLQAVVTGGVGLRLGVKTR